jgi:hypothetical protein
MTDNFRLLMIGAMYENGGNTTHRFLDGHPDMLVYPFESQLGTRYVNDMMTSLFPVKYRWPVFPLDGTALSDYKAIIDEECKVRARTPDVSKFRHMDFNFDDDQRCLLYERYVASSGRSTAANVSAFFRATFDAWLNCHRTGKETFYVGYSPIISVDADKILRDLPDAHVLHVVRNPWSAFADTCKRPVPLSLANYMLGWILNQHYALLFKNKFPDRFHILRIEDILGNPESTLGALCNSLGLDGASSLATVSWNSIPLQQVAPWGTIKVPTPEANRRTALELTEEQVAEIRLMTRTYLEAFDYLSFI